MAAQAVYDYPEEKYVVKELIVEKYEDARFRLGDGHWGSESTMPTGEFLERPIMVFHGHYFPQNTGKSMWFYRAHDGMHELEKVLRELVMQGHKLAVVSPCVDIPEATQIPPDVRVLTLKNIFVSFWLYRPRMIFRSKEDAKSKLEDLEEWSERKHNWMWKEIRHHVPDFVFSERASSVMEMMTKLKLYDPFAVYVDRVRFELYPHVVAEPPHH